MDRELNELLAQEAAASARREQAWGEVTQSLGQLRTSLIREGFSTQGAEDIARDFATALLDRTLDAEDDPE